MEMASYGLLGLLLNTVLVNYAGVNHSYLGFVFFLPLATVRAAEDARGILDLCLALFIISIVITAASFWVIVDSGGYNQLLTVKLLPLLTVDPTWAVSRETLFKIGCMSAFLSAITVRLTLARGRIVLSILRSSLAFAALLALHLYITRDRTYLQPGPAYKREVMLGAFVGLYSLMLVYAGFYVALFYDLVKEANRADTKNQVPQ